MSELRPKKGSIIPEGQEMVLRDTYGGVTVFEATDGGLNLGAGITEKTLKDANRAEVSFYGTRVEQLSTVVSLGVSGGLTANSLETGSGVILYAGASLAVTLGANIGRVFSERTRRKAVAAITKQSLQIPSRDIRVDLDSLPPSLSLATGPVETAEAVRVLQAMQTSHLDSETRSTYDAQHPSHINPAMVARAALLGVDEQSRPKMVEPLFDNVTELGNLTTSLDRFAGLSATKSGREGLTRQTTSMLGILGEVATTFIDLKANEAMPKVEHLIDIADDSLIQQGLIEAKQALGTPELTHHRYELAVRNWSTE